VTWVLHNRALIEERALQHLWIAIPPIALSFLFSIPVGWFAYRFRRIRSFLLGSLGLLYAIPSLPLFIALPGVLGTGLRDPKNVIVALTIYGVALMARATADGLASVDREIQEAGTALGFSGWTRFWRVEFPLAGPVLLAGLRVVAVSTISLTTVGAVLGIKSLGLLFTDGTQRNIPEEVATGIAVTMAIAVLIDAALVVAGRILMPWTVSDR
jgi:osmoprotectant transport system permease protein